MVLLGDLQALHIVSHFEGTPKKLQSSPLYPTAQSIGQDLIN